MEINAEFLKTLKFINFSLKLEKINRLVEPLNYIEIGGILERRKKNFLARVFGQVN